MEEGVKVNKNRLHHSIEMSNLILLARTGTEPAHYTY